MVQKLRFVPLTLSFIVWVLTLCAGLGGRTAMFGNPVLSINTSQLGLNLLNNSNLFNLDNSSILYTLLFEERDPPPTFDNLNQINKDHGVIVPPKNGKNGKVLVPRFNLASLAAAPGTAGTLMSIIGPIYNFIADELNLNKTGFIYQTGFLILNNTSDKLGSETDRFINRVSVVVPAAVINALQTQLYKLAQAYQVPPADLAPRALDSEQQQKHTDSAAWALPETRQYRFNNGPSAHLSQGVHTQMRETLLHDLATSNMIPPNYTTLGQAIASGDFKDFLDNTLRGALSDINGTVSQIANDIDDPNSQSMPARMLRQSRPYISSALRQYVVTQMNTGVGYVKSGFSVHDLYNVYMTQLCYADDTKNGNVRYKGCRNVNDWRDLDLAPPIKRTLNDAGLHRRVPNSIKVGWGPEAAIDGMSKITKLLFAVDMLGIISSGFSFWTMLFSIVVPHSWQRWADNITLASHVLAYTVLQIVFSLSLILVLAGKLVIGNILYVVSGINVPGWGFTIMNIMSVLLMTISVNFVVHIWLQNLKARVARDAIDQHTTARGTADENSSEKGLVSHHGEPFAPES